PSSCTLSFMLLGILENEGVCVDNQEEVDIHHLRKNVTNISEPQIIYLYYN
ncbi:hypothetical protein ACJX0J_041238, partial [Zea mays]